MKIGVVISTDEPEVVWSAFRFGNAALKAGHEVKMFLINRGVEIEDIDDERYNIKEQMDLFFQSKGKALVCGTCLELRQKEGTNICQVSTMKDLLKLVEESDRVLTFG